MWRMHHLLRVLHLEGQGVFLQDCIPVPDGLVGLLAQAIARRVQLPEGQYMILKQLVVGVRVGCAGCSMRDEWHISLQAHLHSHCTEIDVKPCRAPVAASMCSTWLLHSLW